MKTILTPREQIDKLWGHPKPKDTNYRWMKYLLRVTVEDGILLHNTVSRHLILLTNEEVESLPNLPSKPTEPMQELIAYHFLVPDDFDEYKSVNQLRKIYQSRETGDAINHYVILPTTFCNAHCFYCYESDYPRVHMTEETARKLIDYIDEHRKGKNVNIQWFGGEPLVGIKRIDQISQGLKDRGITFTSSMISNGYLFDEEVVKRAVDLWNLKRVQITLDGTEDVYNRVKAYSSINGSPFQKVLHNIDLLISNEIQANVRLNVDFYNQDDIRTLIEELGSRFAGKKYFSAYVNMLFNDQGFEPVHHSQDEILQLAQIVEDDTERLKELKIGFDRNKIPSLQASQCMADNPHAVEIQPDGSFCRCEHETITDSYGSIDVGIVDKQKPLKWLETIERSDYCPDCSIYPACYLLRYCMNADMPCIESFRQSCIKVHCEQIQNVYLRRMEDGSNEEICNS